MNISECGASFSLADGMLSSARQQNGQKRKALKVTPTGQIGPLIEMAAARFDLAASYPAIIAAPGVYSMACQALDAHIISGRGFKDRAGVFPLVRKYSEDSEEATWDQWAKHAENAAVTQKIPRQFAVRLIGALIELCDNVNEHSGRIETGIAAYAASPGKFEFVVADCGIGVLASLKKNPRFADLRDSGEALDKAIRDGNSGLQIPGRGQGLGNLFRALVRDEGELRFRSGDYALSISGSSPSVQGRIELSKQPWFDGMVISARCNPALSPDLFP